MRRDFGRRRLVRCGLVVGLALLLSWSAGCGRVEQAEAAPADHLPNVLIVVLDALRADKLGCYGFERNTSPAIDALARDPDAVVFRRHYVQGAATKPSTASLFTGQFLFQHGVVLADLGQEIPHRPGFYPTQALGDGHVMMAERFGRLGYETFGVVKSYHLLPEFGYARGFDAYFTPDRVQADGDRVNKTIRLIQRSGAPFFGYLHLNACHHPFRPGFRHRGYMERFGFEYDERARIRDGIDFTTAQTKHAILDGELTLDPADVRFLNLVYEAELRAVDEALVAPLIRTLKQIGRYDDTLIILTADHGEELYDHEGYAHGHALWEEIIHVPLIVKFPRGEKPPHLGHEVNEATQSIDLLPSLLSYCGRPIEEDVPGADIFQERIRGSAFCETHLEWALIRGDHKLIDGGGRTLLFNLATDPKERSNLAETEPDRVEDLRAAAEALQAFVAAGPREAPLTETELSQEAIRALRSLGYTR
ncbi:MAG: sulfatase family protein [Planctomycetota bacterium]